MLKVRMMALAAAAALAMPHAAFATTEEDLKDLREQVRHLKESYERRIEALERRLQQAEKAAGKAEAAATQAQSTAAQAAVQASSRPVGENASNPGVSLILNGVYSNLSQDPTPGPTGFRINGFVPTMGEVAPPVRGPSLGESELAFAANIDPHFRGTLIAALARDHAIGVEEGYVQTLSLSSGLTIKAGRFFSGVGYQNQIHAHAWDFADAPLANKVFLGNQLGEDGVQFKWVAPTETYFDLGLELGRGRKFPGGPDGGRNKNGFGSGTLFAHLGGDIGTGTAWQVGLSHLRTSPQNRSYDDLDSTGTIVTNSVGGTSRLWVLDGVLKWAPKRNPTYANFKLQGEYFRRTEDGSFTYNTANTAGAFLGTRTGGFASRQAGWYLQGIYQLMPHWRVGYRYDLLNAGSTGLGLVAPGALTAADLPVLGAYNPTRHSLMADWSPSEFSRLRLQYAQDHSRRGATDNQVFLQYIMSLGAHGAHKF